MGAILSEVGPDPDGPNIPPAPLSAAESDEQGSARAETPPVVFPAATRPLDGPPWADAELARSVWPDSARLSTDQLTELLAAAEDQCRQFAPVLDPDSDVPPRYRLAVVYQARDTHNARTADVDTGNALLTGVFQPRPMGTQVRNLLRPNRGPMVG